MVAVRNFDSLNPLIDWATMKVRSVMQQLFLIIVAAKAELWARSCFYYKIPTDQNSKAPPLFSCDKRRAGIAAMRRARVSACFAEVIQ